MMQKSSPRGVINTTHMSDFHTASQSPSAGSSHPRSAPVLSSSEPSSPRLPSSFVASAMLERYKIVTEQREVLVAAVGL